MNYRGSGVTALWVNHLASCAEGGLWLSCVLTLSPPGRLLRWKDVWLPRCGVHCWWRRRPRHSNWNWQSPGKDAERRTVYFISWTTVRSTCQLQCPVHLPEDRGVLPHSLSALCCCRKAIALSWVTVSLEVWGPTPPWKFASELAQLKNV